MNDQEVQGRGRKRKIHSSKVKTGRQWYIDGNGFKMDRKRYQDAGCGGTRVGATRSGTIIPIARWLACEHRTLHERLDPTVSNLVVRDAQTTEDYYNKWRKSIPLERVQLQPMLLQEPEFMRTEQRAIPTEMRSVLIASRELCSTTILYCLLITYQPGRPGEKALLLKHLTEVTGGKDWAEGGANFRNWRRFF